MNLKKQIIQRKSGEIILKLTNGSYTTSSSVTDNLLYDILQKLKDISQKLNDQKGIRD